MVYHLSSTLQLRGQVLHRAAALHHELMAFTGFIFDPIRRLRGLLSIARDLCHAGSHFVNGDGHLVGFKLLMQCAVMTIFQM